MSDSFGSSVVLLFTTWVVISGPIILVGVTVLYGCSFGKQFATVIIVGKQFATVITVGSSSRQFFVQEKHFFKNKWEAVLRCHLWATAVLI